MTNVPLWPPSGCLYCFSLLCVSVQHIITSSGAFKYTAIYHLSSFPLFNKSENSIPYELMRRDIMIISMLIIFIIYLNWCYISQVCNRSFLSTNIGLINFGLGIWICTLSHCSICLSFVTLESFELLMKVYHTDKLLLHKSPDTLEWP